MIFKEFIGMYGKKQKNIRIFGRSNFRRIEKVVQSSPPHEIVKQIIMDSLGIFLRQDEKILDIAMGKICEGRKDNAMENSSVGSRFHL